jgi:hypothetical protein
MGEGGKILLNRDYPSKKGKGKRDGRKGDREGVLCDANPNVRSGQVRTGQDRSGQDGCARVLESIISTC